MIVYSANEVQRAKLSCHRIRSTTEAKSCCQPVLPPPPFQTIQPQLAFPSYRDALSIALAVSHVLFSSLVSDNQVELSRTTIQEDIWLREHADPTTLVQVNKQGNSESKLASIIPSSKKSCGSIATRCPFRRINILLLRRCEEE